MATLSAGRFYDLVNRFLQFRSSSRQVVFDILKVDYPALRTLVALRPESPELTDDAWLRRREVRGADDVIEVLENSSFVDEPGTTQALFLDERCGLLDTYNVGPIRDDNPAATCASILRRASDCHASGIILATNDASGTIARGKSSQKLTMDLYQKGEATDIFLLDHFVLTGRFWKRMFALKQAGRF